MMSEAGMPIWNTREAKRAVTAHEVAMMGPRRKRIDFQCLAK
jgi:hypothetical protein